MASLYYNQISISNLLAALKLKRSAIGYLDLLAKQENSCTSSEFSPDVEFFVDIPNEKNNIYNESQTFNIENYRFSIISIKFPNENKIEIYLQLKNNNEAQRIIALNYHLKINGIFYLDGESLSMINGPNSQYLMKIVDFNPNLKTQSLSIALKLDKITSAILNFIAQNPEETLIIENLSSLNRPRLIILLKFKLLNIQSEDDALDVVGR